MITSGTSLASTSTDTVTVVPEAWDMQSATAVLTALEVMVAPDMPSTLQVWALRMFSFILSADVGTDALGLAGHVDDDVLDLVLAEGHADLDVGLDALGGSLVGAGV